MKVLRIFFILSVLWVVVLSGVTAFADLQVFDDTNHVTSGMQREMRRAGPLLAAWSHANPFVGDYEAALASGDIVSATLTIVADDVDLGDEIAIYFTGRSRDKQLVGYLEQMTFADHAGAETGVGNSMAGHTTVTTFDIDPAWLRDGGTFGALTSLRYSIPNGHAEIETATLSIAAAVPAPGAAALGALGLVCVGLVRRRRAG